MLRKRNGKFLVFSRLDKETGKRVWHAAKVEKGQLNILVTDFEWIVAARAAEMISTGRMTEFGTWLDGYNSALLQDYLRAKDALTM